MLLLDEATCFSSCSRANESDVSTIELGGTVAFPPEETFETVVGSTERARDVVPIVVLVSFEEILSSRVVIDALLSLWLVDIKRLGSGG